MATKWNKEWVSEFTGAGWLMSKEIPFGGQLSPKLRPKEWYCWVLLHSKNAPENIWKNLIGHKTTIWRVKKRLEKKGYKWQK
jgi:uroporphyrinogen-III synthase